MRVFLCSWREVTITESIFNTYDKDKLCSCLSETQGNTFVPVQEQHHM